jgi:hypothetical protein
LKQEPEVHVVGRLPFWTALGGLAEAGGMEAAVLSMQPPDPSGLDRSLLIYHGDKIADIDRHLIALGFRPADIVKQGDMALIDVEGFVAADDPRLAAAAGTVLAGAYACPVSG